MIEENQIRYDKVTASLCFGVIKTRLTAKTCPAGRLA
jgi:hypothetical protein